MDPTTSASPSLDNAQPAAQNSKQQIVERIRASKNVLVTVGNNPSVDELASALGFTFMLGKLDKHVTAVFSGEIPPAMSFLDPESTFENTIDSLRDFIIALDKEKADKLRYKVEDDIVKIFITPYKTVLKKEDFKFSQGDLNVDVVVTLGVEKREDLDKAITSHGRILHNATVINISAGNERGDLGSINWNDPTASSVAEMLVSISESFASGLLDEQISTAFLTGIVAETNRFSNEKTSPKVMTMAAQLMAAGANQQLIATNLRQEGMISEPVRKRGKSHADDGGEMVLSHHKKKDSQKEGSKTTSAKSQPKETFSTHGVKPTPSPKFSPPAPAPSFSALSQAGAPPSNPPATTLPSVPRDSASITQPTSAITPEQAPDKMAKPTFGGTLNATTELASESREAQSKREADSNNVTLEHGSSSNEDAVEAARRAVEAAANTHVPEQVSPQPPLTTTSNSLPMPEQSTTSQTPPVTSTPAPGPTPAAPVGNGPTPSVNSPTAPAPSGLPPLPPLPNPQDRGVLPMPPLPGQDSLSDQQNGQIPDPTAQFQPQINPTFLQNIPQSQNNWTEAGQNRTTQQAEAQANRQAKMDQMTAQYNQAVERNQQLRQQNNPDDHSTFPLPR